MPATRKTKKRVKRPPPITHSWLVLQNQLRECETSSQVRTILEDELRGPARIRWLKRIQGRLSSLRAVEEIAYLESVAKE